MIINPNDISVGVQAGTGRARRRFNSPSSDLDGQSRDRIETVLGWWPVDLHGEFVRLFVELSATASVTRVYNQEPLLSEDELAAYLAHSASFFNSFKHK